MSNYVKVNTFGQKKERKIKEKKKEKTNNPHQVFSIVFPTLIICVSFPYLLIILIMCLLIVLNFSKNQLLFFTDFLYCFIISYFTDFC